MNFVCIVFELGDEMLTLLSMENLIVQCNPLVKGDGSVRARALPVGNNATPSHVERQLVAEFGLFFSILLLVYGANILKFHLVSSYRMHPHSFLYKRAPRRVPAIYSLFPYLL